MSIPNENVFKMTSIAANEVLVNILEEINNRRRTLSNAVGNQNTTLNKVAYAKTRTNYESVELECFVHFDKVVEGLAIYETPSILWTCPLCLTLLS
jgi:hypothetical protein